MEKRRLWGDIAAAAESGRDFSARWFTSEGPVAGKMGSTRTSQIMPVDLNAIMCGNLRTIADLFVVVGESERAILYRNEYEAMRECIYQVLLLFTRDRFHRFRSVARSATVHNTIKHYLLDAFPLLHTIFYPSPILLLLKATCCPL